MIAHGSAIQELRIAGTRSSTNFADIELAGSKTMGTTQMVATTSSLEVPRFDCKLWQPTGAQLTTIVNGLLLECVAMHISNATSSFLNFSDVLRSNDFNKFEIQLEKLIEKGGEAESRRRFMLDLCWISNGIQWLNLLDRNAARSLLVDLLVNLLAGRGKAAPNPKLKNRQMSGRRRIRFALWLD